MGRQHNVDQPKKTGGETWYFLPPWQLAAQEPNAVMYVPNRDIINQLASTSRKNG